MGQLGFSEIIFILLVALVVFGPDKLPEVGRTLGKAVRELKMMLNRIDTDIQQEVDEIKKTADYDQMSSTVREIKDVSKDVYKAGQTINSIRTANPLKHPVKTTLGLTQTFDQKKETEEPSKPQETVPQTPVEEAPTVAQPAVDKTELSIEEKLSRLKSIEDFEPIDLGEPSASDTHQNDEKNHE